MKLMLFVLGSLVSAAASAGVYKCTAPDGNTVYQSSPCAAGENKMEINPKTGVSTDLNAIQNQQLMDQNSRREELEQQQAEQERRAQQQAQLQRDAQNESEKNQLLVKNNPSKFSAYAIPPYTFGSLLPLVKRFEARLPDIERLRRKAAEKALASEQCGRVEAAELNIKSTNAALVFLIDCSSGKHFYYNEQELAK
ncbi:MAG: DUF4124 domain-containing protein [Gammaproteobacteria bacterium]